MALPNLTAIRTAGMITSPKGTPNDHAVRRKDSTFQGNNYSSIRVSLLLIDKGMRKSQVFQPSATLAVSWGRAGHGYAAAAESSRLSLLCCAPSAKRLDSARRNWPTLSGWNKPS